jgi:hypothetical protein
MFRIRQFEQGPVAIYESPPARSAPPTEPPWPIATTLRAIVEAWRESLAACREYEELRSWGMSHDAALREALGLMACARRETAQPLYFGGRA